LAGGCRPGPKPLESERFGWPWLHPGLAHRDGGGMFTVRSGVFWPYENIKPFIMIPYNIKMRSLLCRMPSRLLKHTYREITHYRAVKKNSRFADDRPENTTQDALDLSANAIDTRGCVVHVRTKPGCDARASYWSPTNSPRQPVKTNKSRYEHMRRGFRGQLGGVLGTKTHGQQNKILWEVVGPYLRSPEPNKTGFTKILPI
jgi:hypothetical protein